MAVKSKLRQTTQEKNYYTLQFLESAYVLGNEVKITPVKTYSLGDKSGETFTYDPEVNTFIIFDERPKVQLLQRLGWFREGEDSPIIAYVPTHLLYDKPEDEEEEAKVVNDAILSGTSMKKIINNTDEEYELKPIKITRGAIVDIKYDFVVNSESKFYVTDSKIDTVSLQYVARLVPYKDVEVSQVLENDINTTHIKFNTEAFGI